MKLHYIRLDRRFKVRLQLQLLRKQRETRRRLVRDASKSCHNRFTVAVTTLDIHKYTSKYHTARETVAIYGKQKYRRGGRMAARLAEMEEARGNRMRRGNEEKRRWMFTWVLLATRRGKAILLLVPFVAAECKQNATYRTAGWGNQTGIPVHARCTATINE